MAGRSIGSRSEGAEARKYIRALRTAAEERAKERGISLVQALRQLGSEGMFSASSAARDRTVANLQAERNGCKGWARSRLARLVEEKRKELMTRNPDLSEVEAFRRATDLALREDSHLLSDYRKDVEVLR
jgi:hypothetical protein